MSSPLNLLGCNVLVHTKYNNYRYSGEVVKEDDKFITLLNKKRQMQYILAKDDISNISQEVEV